jgi:hypothetical protein
MRNKASIDVQVPAGGKCLFFAWTAANHEGRVLNWSFSTQ